jgi:hypothetical protein
MARSKSSPLEDVIVVVSKLLWWAGAALALVSYLILDGFRASGERVLPAQRVPGDEERGQWSGWRHRSGPVPAKRDLPGAVQTVEGVQGRRAVGAGILWCDGVAWCCRGYFVTSGEYTGDAKTFVRGLNLELIDGRKLREMISLAQQPVLSRFKAGPVVSPVAQSAPLAAVPRVTPVVTTALTMPLPTSLAASFITVPWCWHVLFSATGHPPILEC